MACKRSNSTQPSNKGKVLHSFKITNLWGHRNCWEQIYVINNGNRTGWSSVWSVMIRVINKSDESNFLITSMITDRIGRHKVLQINHNHFNFREEYF